MLTSFLLEMIECLYIVNKVDRMRKWSHLCSTAGFRNTKRKSNLYNVCFSPGFEHQDPMPNVPMSDQLVSQEELRKRYLSDPRIPLKKRQRVASGKTKLSPLDVKEVDLNDEVAQVALPPWQSVWIKTKGKLTDNAALQRCAAVYASAWMFLHTAGRPHRQVPIRLLSLDHSMWFHKPFRADEWLLFVQSSPRASNGRGSAYGHFYNQNGELVMTACQEGLIRKIQKSNRPSSEYTDA